MDELEADRRAGVYKGSAVERFRTQHRSLTERLAQLHALPTREPTTVVRDTGRTVAAEWHAHNSRIIRSSAADESGEFIIDDPKERKALRERGERGHNELYRTFRIRVGVKQAPVKGARSFNPDRLIFTYEPKDPEQDALDDVAAQEEL
ncbi:hypothetical protein [Streptomyces sp. TE33382]